MDERKIREYLTKFDEEFGTETLNKVDIDDMKLMKVIFQHLSDKLYLPSEKRKCLQHNHIELSDRFIATLNDTQKKMFYELKDIEIRLAAESEEQYFIAGSIFTRELDRELTTTKEGSLASS